MRPALLGLLGAGGLVLFYLGIVSVAQDLRHALELLWTDRYLVGAIAAGFGTQVGLYVYLRLERRRVTASSAAATATGTGTSSVAMVACCLHHVTDVAPILGLSGAAVFLAEYRLPFMVAGIATNAIGIAIMLRALGLRPFRLFAVPSRK